MEMFAEYQNILGLKYAIIDIINAMYNRNYTMNNNNIYSSAIYHIFKFDDDKDVDIPVIESTDVESDITEEYLHKISFNLISHIRNIPTDEIKNIANDVKSIVYSKKYSDYDKSVKIIEICNRILNSLNSILKILDGDMNKLISQIIKIFYNYIILKLLENKKYEKAVFILISFYNRIINWPSNLMVIDIEPEIIKLKVKPIIDNKSYLIGEFDDQRFKLQSSNSIFLKYIASIDGYAYIYFNHIKYIDFFFLLDILDYIDSIKKSPDVPQEHVEGIISLLSSFILKYYKINVSEFMANIEKIHKEVNSTVTKCDSGKASCSSCI